MRDMTLDFAMYYNVIIAIAFFNKRDEHLIFFRSWSHID